MTALNTYLSLVKAKKNDAKLLILGNEAADLDSMASSLAYGYLLHQQHPDMVVLPVMSIPRADFKLRTEAVYLFQKAGVELADVVFFDEIDFAAAMESGANLVLVDHNKLSPSLEQYNDNVTAVLDHHVDEGLYLDATPRIIETIGSCTSLVGKEFRRNSIDIPQDVAILLVGTILLDTVNLDEKAGRVTPADKVIAEHLFSLCSVSGQELFDTIQKEKFNVAGLSTTDLLRKDYKEFQFEMLRCGIASALLPVSQWQAMDQDLFSGFVGYADTCELDVLLSMNAFANPDFSRDLIIFCATQTAHDGLLAYLQENGLDLVLIDEHNEKQQGNKGFMRCYNQKNLGISRKKLQPLLADYYKGE